MPGFGGIGGVGGGPASARGETGSKSGRDRFWSELSTCFFSFSFFDRFSAACTFLKVKDAVVLVAPN